MTNPHGAPLIRALLVAVAFLATAVAGCVGPDDAMAGAPNAELAVQEETYFAGDPVRFDVAGSSDKNGDIATYRLDFGDGESTEVNEGEIDMVEHVYEAPGVYTVTLVVEDDGEGQDMPLNDTDEADVHINDNMSFTVPLLVAFNDDGPQDDAVANNHSETFEAFEHASGIEIDIDLQGALVVGTTTAAIRLLNETGEAIAQENVTIDGDDTATAHLFELIDEPGNYTLEILTESGTLRGTGSIVVFYGDVPDPEIDEMPEAADNNTTLRQY